MITQLSNLNRRGISLVEILIGIMVLGIGVISLATLFPIGLLKMRRAINDVRGTVVSRSALSDVRVRNLLAPPFGPPATYFSQYPNTAATHWPGFTTRPTIDIGIPVIIDPLWMIQTDSLNQADPTNHYFDHFGAYDFAPADGIPDGNAPAGGEGILRVRGGPLVPLFPPPPPFLALELMSEVFASPDDLTYGQNETRVLPLQFLNPAAPPPYLTPTNGTPFAPGTLALSRERRYTWMIMARKVRAGQIYHPGANGTVGSPAAEDAGPDRDILEDVGPDLVVNTADDPARNMLTAAPEPAPIGPFDVTIIAFYTRDFATRETVFANPPPWNAASRIFRQGSDVVTLVKRTDLPFPEIPLNGYLMDTTFDSTPGGLRNGFVYRVVSRSFDALGNLVLVLDQPARADGFVLTVLKGAVGVFEKQVP